MSAGNRNQPCACGSGKKSKHCCGSELKKNEAYRREREAFRRRLEEHAKASQNQSNQPQPSIRRAPSMSMALLMAATISMGAHRKP